MKEVILICPNCGHLIIYKNWFSWIWHTPFHWFVKRRIKCDICGEHSYVERERKK